MSPPAEPSRYHAFDSLRASMMLLVCVCHAALPYVTIPLTVNDPSAHLAFDVLVVSIYGSCMPVFFVITGFFGALLHERRGTAGLLRNRAWVVALPLAVGYLTIVPATRGAEDFAVAVAASGSVREGLDLLARWDWVRLDKAYHLWFLLALTVYYPVVLGARWTLARTSATVREPLARALRRAVASPWRAGFHALAIVALLLAAEAAPGPVGKGACQQLALLSFFGLGWLLFGWRDLLPRLERRAWVPLTIAAGALPVLTWALRRTNSQAFGEAGPAILVAGVAGAAFAACAVYGLLGVFLTRFGHPWRATRYVSDASYWIYLVHFPLVLFVGGALSPLDLPAGLKYALVLVVVTSLLLASYHVGVRNTLIGRVLNGARPRAART